MTVLAVSHLFKTKRTFYRANATEVNFQRKRDMACGHKGTMHPKGNEDTRENRAFIHNSSSMSFRTASDRGRSETAKRVDVLCVID
jgi:hypothetical protein